MSGLIHPVGPEQGRTYWVRRIAVLAVVVLAVVAIVSTVVGLSARAAEPDPEAAPVADTPSPSASPSPHAETPEPTPTPGPGQPTPNPETPNPETPTPGAPETPDATASSPGAPDDGRSRRSAENEAEAEASPADQPTPGQPGAGQPGAGEAGAGEAGAGEADGAPAGERAQAPQCLPEQLQVEVDGPSEIGADAGPQTFGVVVSNTTEEPCTVPVSAENLNVKVAMGEEQVWSSADCPVVLPARTAYLAPGAWLSSDVAWGVSRSAPDCGTAPGDLAAGDYVVTAELTDVPAAQRNLTITG